MPDTPIRMPVETYRATVSDLLRRIWAQPAAMSRDLRDTFREEAEGLLDWRIAHELVAVLHSPPYVCGCGALFRTSLPPVACDACQKKAERAALEAEIEAKVRAEMAQKGEF